MSDEYENKSGYQAQSSETMDGTGSNVSPDMDYVRPAEKVNKICTMRIVLLRSGYFAKMQKL